MAIEQAVVAVIRKPWGSSDLQPWSAIHDDGTPIGELWFQRSDANAPEPALLLKLLFTKEPLSIQVHPDDAFAHSIGLKRGKTEAWYILSATPDAKIAIGLQRRLTVPQLRAAIEDGSIADLVQWHRVVQNDVIYIPAGTIHAIGAGLVIAEIQQRSDATFRLFDHGRERELHIENAIAVANAGPADFRAAPTQLTDARTLLISNAHFMFERIDLAPDSAWSLAAMQETWLVVIGGNAQAGSFDIATGDAIFAQSDCVNLKVGSAGLVGLLAHTGVSPVPYLLQRVGQPEASFARQPQEIRVPTLLSRVNAMSAGECLMATQ